MLYKNLPQEELKKVMRITDLVYDLSGGVQFLVARAPGNNASAVMPCAERV